MSLSIVQPAFYAQLPFSSAASASERQLVLEPGSQGDGIDRALDLLAAGATIVGVVLPPAELGLDEVDEEVAAVMAEVSARLLGRSAVWAGIRQLRAADIGVIDAHVASGAAVRRQLRDRAVSSDACIVDTPEIWQGQERPLMVVKHTLTGQQRISDFGLEPGRWCVMLSRHQLGCIIVTREGEGNTLREHRHNCGGRPIGATNAEWYGWQAHRTIWANLHRQGRLIYFEAHYSLGH